MEAKARYNPPCAFKVQNALSTVVTILGSMLLFAVAANKSLSVPQYAAFNTSFGMVSGAILELTSVAAMISALRPIMDLAEPILKAKPEVCEERQIVKKVKGSIELNNISFRYTDSFSIGCCALSGNIPGNGSSSSPNGCSRNHGFR